MHACANDYCLRALHLREGAAGRRIGAMRVLRQFPRLAPALRDGRLCLSTAVVLAPHLNDDNLEALVARAAFKTKAEVEHLAATLAPRHAPRDGVRRVAAPHEPAMSICVEEAPPPALDTLARPAMQAAAAVPAARPTVPPTRPTITAVAAETYSLRVTVDDVFKRDLDSLKSVLSHVVPDGDLAAVLHEAVRCALEKTRSLERVAAPAAVRERCFMAMDRRSRPLVDVPPGDMNARRGKRSHAPPATLRPELPAPSWWAASPTVATPSGVASRRWTRASMEASGPSTAPSFASLAAERARAPPRRD